MRRESEGAATVLFQSPKTQDRVAQDKQEPEEKREPIKRENQNIKSVKSHQGKHQRFPERQRHPKDEPHLFQCAKIILTLHAIQRT